MTAELAKCGPEAANILFAEAEKHVDFARQRVEMQKEQARKLESRRLEMQRIRTEAATDAADPTAPMQVEVPVAAIGAVLGRGGNTLKRLIAATGCPIDVPQQGWSSPNGLVSISLGGKAKQRRLAKEAIHLIVDGGDADDVAARIKGALIVPHGVGHPGREEWLEWRLKAVEFDTGLKVQLTRTSVRLLPKEGGSALDDASEEREACTELIEGIVGDAQALVELSVDAKGEHEPTNERIALALGPLMDQHGVLAKALKPEDDVVPILVLGPPEAARDAAAILWAHFVQGKATAAIIQVKGRIQAMSELMSKDFDKDLRALEEDCEVEITQSDHTLWIAGADEEAVAEARKTVCEMLQFYLAEDFLLLEGLTKEGLQQLKEDPELRTIARDPECAVAFDRAQSSAWVCGPRRRPAAAAARRRVEALARVGGVSVEAVAAEAAAEAAAVAAVAGAAAGAPPQEAAAAVAAAGTKGSAAAAAA